MRKTLLFILLSMTFACAHADYSADTKAEAARALTDFSRDEILEASQRKKLIKKKKAAHHRRHSEKSKCRDRDRETIDSKVEIFSHTLLMELAQWDTEKLVRVTIPGSRFSVKVEVRVQDKFVTLAVPSIDFDLSFNGEAVQGFAFTVPGTNLHKDLWPAQLMGERFVVGGQETGISYALTIGTDGALTISAPDGSPIPANDGQRVNATTISYLLPNHVPPVPKNVQLSKGLTNIIGSVDRDEYLDYYANDIQQDQTTGLIRTAWCWASNSEDTVGGGGPLPRNFLAMVVKTATVDPKTGEATYGPTVQATFPGPNVFHAEAKIAINPTNVNNLVLMVTSLDYQTGITTNLVVYSFDCGLTWRTANVPWTDADGVFDPWVIFDKFGNCFVSYGTYPGPGGSFQIANSIDGGQTFSIITSIPSIDFANGGFTDFSKISIGPDGTGNPNKLALWFNYDDASFSALGVFPTIGFVPVTGLGAYGSPVFFNDFTEIPSGDQQIGLSELIVNPVTGAVYWFSTSVNDFTGANNTNSDAMRISLWVNPSGTVGYNPASFLPRRDIQINNMGISPGGLITTRLAPWAPLRGVGEKGVAVAGYDASKGRLWFCGIDMRPALSNQNVVVLAYSDDEGKTWSNQWLVNEDQCVFVGMPTIAVEKNTGIMAVGWYDPRQDPKKQQSVGYFGTVIPAP